MTNFNITINAKNKHTSKPTSASVESMNTCTPVSVDLQGLANIVLQPNGSTFCPATFNNNKRKNDQWLSQQAFCLDFDEGFTPDEALELLAGYEIIPNIIYTSFSDTPAHRKFRLIIVLDQVVTNADTAKWIIVNLMNLFGKKADKACKDLSRMFYGSGATTAEFFSKDFTEYQKLIDVLNTVQIANDRGETKKCLFEQAVYTEEAVVDAPLKTGATPGTPNIYKDIRVQPVKIEGVYNDGLIIDKFDFDKAAENVQIFADFLNGKWLTHPQLFGIATSMRWIEGGIKLMRDTMNKYNKTAKTNYSGNNFSILTYVPKMKYTPSNLESFSPYEDDFQYTNIISAARQQQGMVTQYEKYSEITVDEATELLEDKLNMILSERPKNKVFVIKVPTGLGKTQFLTHLTKTSATIAFPTHNLKDEVATRFFKNGTEVKVTPNLPAFSEEVMIQINKLADLNLNSDINSLIKNIARDTKEDVKVGTSFFTGSVRRSKYKSEDVELAKEYMIANQDCYNDKENIILTTHTKATYIDFASDLMIFDEDPMQQLLAINTLDALEFKKIVACLPESETSLKSVFESLYRWVVDITGETEYQKAKLIQILAEKRDLIREIILNPKNNFTKSNLMAFLDASHFQKAENNTINFIVRNEIKGLENKTVIIMSATASETIYTNMGFDCEIVDLGKVKMAGKIVQDTTYSLSKQSLINHIGVVSEKVGNLPVITFSDLKSKFKNPVSNMHFGNCAGYDDLNGKDIAVVGTFNRPLFVYVLIALALEQNIEMKSIKPETKEVKYNGYKFQLNTWENKFITAVQMDLINSELVQATGRARALRQDCTVHLYSGFPLRDTSSFSRGMKVKKSK